MRIWHSSNAQTSNVESSNAQTSNVKSSNSKSRALRVIKDAALLLVTVALAFSAFLSIHLHVGIITISSGSMAPYMRTGDIALTFPIPKEQVRVGDVVVLPHPDEPSLNFAHRVVSVDRSREGIVVETKGDANPIKDGWRLELRSDQIPKVGFTIPTSRLPFDSSARALLSQLLFLVAIGALALSFRRAREPSPALDARDR